MSEKRTPPVTGETPSGDYCCKVSRVGNAYGISGLDTELRRRREAADATLYDLVEFINTRLTTAALTDGSVDTDADPATVYAALVGDSEISATRQDSIRETLAGRLDLERLQTDFVSHETVRKHLKEHLGIDTSRGGFENVEELREALETHQRQYRDAVEGALQRAAREGLLDGTEFRVYQTRVECGDCSRTHRLTELIENGGCECNSDS